MAKSNAQLEKELAAALAKLATADAAAAQLEQEKESHEAEIATLQKQLADAGKDKPPAGELERQISLLEAKIDAKAQLISEHVARIAKLTIGNRLMAERVAQLEDEIDRLSESPASPRPQALLGTDPFGAAARAEVTADQPAAAGGISETAIREKILAGLTRAQAIEVINAQRAEDAKASSNQRPATSM